MTHHDHDDDKISECRPAGAEISLPGGTDISTSTIYQAASVKHPLFVSQM